MGFDPGTISLALGGLGAITSAAGALRQGAATSNAASYQAQIARNNAIIAGQNADYAAKAGVEKATAQSMKSAATMGKIRTAIAAGGIDVNTGSPVNVEESQRRTGELDTETTMHNALLQVYGYRTAQTSDEAQARLYEQESRDARTGGILCSTAGLLGSASSLG